MHIFFSAGEPSGDQHAAHLIADLRRRRPDLRVRLGELELANPVVTAAGCAGAGRELARFFDIARIGAVVTKSVTVEPRAGWPAPRIAETPSGPSRATSAMREIPCARA